MYYVNEKNNKRDIIGRLSKSRTQTLRRRSWNYDFDTTTASKL